MTASPDLTPFSERFLAFADSCSEEEQQFLAWLFSADLAGDGSDAGADASVDVEGFGSGQLGAMGQMQEAQMSFNLQYLQLQSQMQHENRSYTAISNIMQAKRNASNNAIGRIR